MAIKRTVIEEKVPDTSEKVIDDPLLDDEITLQAIRERYGVSGATYKLYKMVKGGNPQWCYDSIDTIEESDIQNRYGGGRYAIRIYIDKRLRDTVYIELADPAPERGSGIGSEDKVASVMIQMLQAQNQQTQNLLMAIIGRPTPITQPTPVADTVALFNLMKQNQPLSGDSLVGKIVEKFLDDLGHKGESTGDWKSEAVKTIREVAPAALMAFAGHGAAPGMGMGMPPGAVIVPGNGTGNGTHANQAPVAMIPENPAMPTTQNGTQNGTMEHIASEETTTKLLLSEIKPKIFAGMLPAGLAIEWMLANSADPNYQPIIKLALNKTIDDLIKIDPEIANAPYKPWFVEVLTEVKKAYSERDSDSEPDDDEQQNGKGERRK